MTALFLSGGRIYAASSTRGLDILTDPFALKPLLFTAVARTETGGIRLSLQGPARQSVGIERSTDLMKWEHWMDETLGDGSAELSDAALVAPSQRFYRVRTR